MDFPERVSHIIKTERNSNEQVSLFSPFKRQGEDTMFYSRRLSGDQLSSKRQRDTSLDRVVSIKSRSRLSSLDFPRLGISPLHQRETSLDRHSIDTLRNLFRDDDNISLKRFRKISIDHSIRTLEERGNCENTPESSDKKENSQIGSGLRHVHLIRLDGK